MIDDRQNSVGFQNDDSLNERYNERYTERYTERKKQTTVKREFECFFKMDNMRN